MINTEGAIYTEMWYKRKTRKEFKENPVKTISQLVIQSEEIQNLSRFKKWICKIFKITPETLYNTTVKFKIEDEGLIVSDVICIGDESFLIIEHEPRGVFTAKCLRLLPEKIKPYHTELCLSQTQFIEGE